MTNVKLIIKGLEHTLLQPCCPLLLDIQNNKGLQQERKLGFDTNFF